MNNVEITSRNFWFFIKLRQNEYYYVDKTILIKRITGIKNRRSYIDHETKTFWKTIGMSMLAYFFDIQKTAELFEDLKISRDIELCQKWMNQYPLFPSKDVDGLNFQSTAMKMLRNQISWICNEHDYLSDSERKLNENDKRSFWSYKI